MNQVLKNRMVGVAVLLLFSAIVWPLLFRFDSTGLVATDQEISEQAESIDQQIAQLRKDTQEIQERVLGSSEEELERERKALSEAIESHPELVLPESPEDVGSFVDNEPVISKPASNSPAQLDSQGIPVSWVAQIATFGSWENADTLMQKLIAEGFKAYQRPADKSFAGPYVVYVGPTLDKAQSEDVAKEIEEEFKTGKGIVKRFKGGLR